MNNSFFNGNVKIYLVVVLLLLSVVPFINAGLGTGGGSGTCGCYLEASPYFTCLEPSFNDQGDNCNTGYYPVFTGSCPNPQVVGQDCSPITPASCTCVQAGGSGCTNECTTDFCINGASSLVLCEIAGSCLVNNTLSCTNMMAASCSSQMPQGCGGDGYICHRANSGTNEWNNNVLSAEINCNDGFDNDCNGFVDGNDQNCIIISNNNAPSEPKLKFRQGTSQDYAAVLGSNGIMDIKGSLTQSQSSITSTTNDFLIKDSSGVVVSKIDYNGNIFLKGQLFEDQTGLSSYLTNGQREFVVKNAFGTVIAVFDRLGNLYISGSLRTNIPSPQ